MAAETKRPSPVPDPDSAPYWEACREHRLTAQRCAGCGCFRWPPTGVCSHCQQRGGEWTTLRGTGTVASYVVAQRAIHPAFAEQVPYTIAYVALDEAPDDLVIVSNLIDVPWKDVHIGMRVQVTFEDLPDGASVPLFRSAEA